MYAGLGIPRNGRRQFLSGAKSSLQAASLGISLLPTPKTAAGQWRAKIHTYGSQQSGLVTLPAQLNTARDRQLRGGPLVCDRRNTGRVMVLGVACLTQSQQCMYKLC